VEKRRARLAQISTERAKENVTGIASQNAEIVIKRLREWNAAGLAEVIAFRGDQTLVVPRELLRSLCEFAREDAELQFNLLSGATCVDRFPAEPRFELNYQLVSIPHGRRFALRVRVPGSDPVVDSLVPVWPGANWLEREIFDLFGIRFTGHPDLRRILLPDDFEGHPLRRDFPVHGYRDIPEASFGIRKNL
jgi:NADH-quinone oxidoreductase subunit C